MNELKEKVAEVQRQLEKSVETVVASVEKLDGKLFGNGHAGAIENLNARQDQHETLDDGRHLDNQLRFKGLEDSARETKQSLERTSEETKTSIDNLSDETKKSIERLQKLGIKIVIGLILIQFAAGGGRLSLDTVLKMLGL